MNMIAQLVGDTSLPRMVKVRQHFYAPEVEDTAEAAREAMQDAGVLSRIASGDRVAIAVGSRGVADIPVLVREVVNAVKLAGGLPFLIPAMGSHGGATAEGQRSVLEHLGVTESFTGAPIRASMDVVQVGELPNGLPVYADKLAFEADKVIVINRIKPHTAFRGPFESGLTKMITIGLGKQKGAEAAHAYSFKYMAEHIPAMAKIVLSKVPIIFGLGTIENAYDHVAKVVAVPAEKLAEAEPLLLAEAKSLMPRIMVDPIDVLVVDEIGKNISGDGMDPNITGRYGTPYASGGPKVTRIAVLGLTEATEGNGNGIGLADVTTRRAVEQIAAGKGYANAITSTVLEMVKIPLTLESAELAVQTAVKTCNAFDLSKVRLVRIENTLNMKHIWVSESLLPELRDNPDIEVLTEPIDMNYADQIVY
ncbi:lactate racemase domain-containing protein [Paenibacillus thalictri]|uniref:DUF2088 domain-containing protein n=1 Tax=Paenibacillus thalictri TaxID=2527873 RepID=A0A4Q9DRI7_9BACL|nr:lactate racemase domain-containing protein [Paenibacillus thalictri]TBL79379.1 DUF2088 domain-containing protein [Paenibacillus thalictri]